VKAKINNMKTRNNNVKVRNNGTKIIIISSSSSMKVKRNVKEIKNKIKS
jgi:hypothetical protein